MVFMNCDRLKRTFGADRSNIETYPSCPRISPRYRWMLCALAAGCIVGSAQAGMTTIKFQPNSADINDLDHRLVHTRRIDGISPGRFAVTGSTLSVGILSRWDANPNVRHLPLLNAAINLGIDKLTGTTLVTNVNDAFGNIRYHSHWKWPTKAGSDGPFLANSTFTNKDYVFDFGVSHRQTFAAHWTSGGGIGLALDRAAISSTTASSLR
jgi:hypothetical protein